MINTTRDTPEFQQNSKCQTQSNKTPEHPNQHDLVCKLNPRCDEQSMWRILETKREMSAQVTEPTHKDADFQTIKATHQQGLFREHEQRKPRREGSMPWSNVRSNKKQTSTQQKRQCKATSNKHQVDASNRKSIKATSHKPRNKNSNPPQTRVWIQNQQRQKKNTQTNPRHERIMRTNPRHERIMRTNPRHERIMKPNQQTHIRLQSTPVVVWQSCFFFFDQAQSLSQNTSSFSALNRCIWPLLFLSLRVSGWSMGHFWGWDGMVLGLRRQGKIMYAAQISVGSMVERYQPSAIWAVWRASFENE